MSSSYGSVCSANVRGVSNELPDDPNGASVKQLVGNSFGRAWAQHESKVHFMSALPSEVSDAVESILANGSAPNRQFLLTIAAGTLDDPESNPASLQQQSGEDGVDRRGMAYRVRDALTDFRDAHGLTLKISQDAGVSNQWREREITQEWVDHRRKQDKTWANAFLLIVIWLTGSEDRVLAATALLDYVSVRVIQIAVENALDYPRFRATPRIAMDLVRSFLNIAPDRPDAMEAVVTVGARTLSSVLASKPTAQRRDINSPDPIDVVITSEIDDTVKSGIEVTDAPIKLSKIQHEVVPAMLKLGLDRATVVSRGTPIDSESEIDKYLIRAFTHFGHRIDLATVDIIETWLSFPGAPRDLATDFLWDVGEELDQYSKADNRRAWFNVLIDYAEDIEQSADEAGNEIEE